VLLTLLSLFSLKSLPKLEVQFTFGDKLVHAVFYFILTILHYLYQKLENKKYTDRTALYIVVSFSFIYGMVIEGLQYMLPYKRSADWLDVVANTVGILLAIWVIPHVVRKIKALKKIN
jgi:VanZ family protein